MNESKGQATEFPMMRELLHGASHSAGMTKTPLVSNQRSRKGSADHGNDDQQKQSSQLQQPQNNNAESPTRESVDPQNLIKSLEEVKSSFETEAESSILKAIEISENKREEKGGRESPKFRNIPFTSPVEEELLTQNLRASNTSIPPHSRHLSGVPASAVHLFEDEGGANNTNEVLSRASLPTTLEIVKPTDTATPSLKDITNRMVMMKRLALVREKTIRNIQQDAQNTDFHVNVDPESLKDEETLRTERLVNNPIIDNGPDTDDTEESEGKVRKAKRCGCRRGSRSAFVSLFMDGFQDSGKYMLKISFYLVMLLIFLSGILFYLAENPIGALGASYSWWLLFAARHNITLLLAQCTQFIAIDYVALETRLAVLLVGRLLTLMAVQAKGWPLILVFWALWNLGFNCGDSSYTRNWLYMQDFFDMFNANNPSGNVVQLDTYRRYLIFSIGIGLAVMIKRILVALWLGRKNYVRYAGMMESLMRKALLISEVSMVSQDIALGSDGDYALPALTSKNTWLFAASKTQHEEEDDKSDEDGSVRGRLASSELYSYNKHEGDSSKDLGEDTSSTTPPKQVKTPRLKWKKNLRQVITPSINAREAKRKSQKEKKSKAVLLSREFTERIEMANLLGEWEEPEIRKKEMWRDTSIRKILQFRETLQYLDGGYPLSISFGPADTRKQCMRSAQNVYNRLTMKDSSSTDTASVLHFDILIRALATDRDGKIQADKARALIRLFRPDREGKLTSLDFIKTCDRIYRRIKMFRVNTSNAARIDEAFEGILNKVFFFLLSLLVLFCWGVNPLGMFTALTGLLLPLSFLFSAASSKYFEGMLLILVRQPYDIGDRISISPAMVDTSNDGSTTWYVEDITLFMTTVRNGATNEVATYANGSLASLRIINAARSSNATVTIKLKFGVDVPYEKVKVFRTVVEGFVKARPREWVKLLGFRAIAVEADLGYIQYIIILQHIESWQNIGAIKESLADVASFCLEVSKKMEMRFVSPPLSLRVEEKRAVQIEEFITEGSSNVDSDVQKIAQMFGEKV